MTASVTISVGGVLKYFLAPLALCVGGVVGGVVLALMLPLSRPSGGRFDTSGLETSVKWGAPVGFAAASAASAYFFGWQGVVLPAVLASLVCVPAMFMLRR
jgi:hypothetical protein